ncbi:MAG TPA: GMC family oxidoreductase [Bryobacteraceae bacterium]
MKEPIGGPFQPPRENQKVLGPLQRLPRGMQRFADSECVDYVVVGLGAGGGVMLQRLAKAGFRVVGLDAGPFWDSERDWVSDEKGAHNLYWNDLRITGGKDPLAFGENNSGKGVGGSTVHWAAFTPRFHPSDFRVRSEDGLGFDWPISYYDLKPYYELLERELPVAGPAYFPWGDPHGYSYGPHPLGGVGNVLVKGCSKLGIGVCAGGPVAINSGSRGDRPHCIYRGYCIQACKVGAKASTLITHIPEALRYGAEVRDWSMVFRISMRDRRWTDGVFYYDREGREHFQRAKAVIVAGYSIETPRLLMNSACAGHERGIANSSDALGRYLMAQAGNVVLGRFAEPIRMYKAPPAHALSEDFYETDPRRDFVRGFAIQTVGPLPIAFAKQMMKAKGAWGWGMRRILMDYNHWAALGVLGEILPWADNRVTIAEDKDEYGIPVARSTFAMHENDKKLTKFGVQKVKEVLLAAGAEEVVEESRYAHLVGAARMGNDPADSVVDRFGRTHDVNNLFISDGSVLPTQGSANPGLTIMSLSARTADYLISQGTQIFESEYRDMTDPPLRRHLAVAGTFSKGVPRVF